MRVVMGREGLGRGASFSSVPAMAGEAVAALIATSLESAMEDKVEKSSVTSLRIESVPHAARTAARGRYIDEKSCRVSY
jgi:hypothetical protein